VPGAWAVIDNQVLYLVRKIFSILHYFVKYIPYFIFVIFIIQKIKKL